MTIRIVSPSVVVCKVCGIGMSFLPPHLRYRHGMTVAQYRAKYPGVCLSSTYLREVRSKTGAANWADPEFRRRTTLSIKEYCSDPGVRQERSLRHRQKWSDPEYRKRISKAVSTYWRTPEGKEKRRKIVDASASDSACEKRSSSMSANWQNPEYRKRQHSGVVRSFRDGSHACRISEALKFHWSDPEVREEASEWKKEVHKRDPEYAERISKSHKKRWTGLSQTEKEEWVRRIRVSVHPNHGELVLNRLLKEHFPGEFKMNVSGKVMTIGTKIPDFVNVNGKKVVVELFGDYWHGRVWTGRSRKDEERKRRKVFSACGFKTVIVWASELAKNPRGVIRRIEEAVR